MIIPPGHTVESVTEAVNNAVLALAPSFCFGYYEQEDISQEIWVLSLVALESGQYDPSRPLPNFLYSTARNRLNNLKRNKVRRTDAPCQKCHEGVWCSEFGVCQRYFDWALRNSRKASLSYPASTGRGDAWKTEEVSDDIVATNELVDLVDASLPPDVRSTLKRMQDGVRVPKSKRDKVEAAVRLLLGDSSDV